MYTVKILDITEVTHDVKRFRFEKPEGYFFTPGQATEVSVNKPGWEEEKRPFTFTSLNSAPYLEFTIKRYADHNGVTNQIHQLQTDDTLIIRDVWGAIEYKGPGYFIAGGAGITPFLAILRQLNADNALNGNKLLFANKTAKDIICHDELHDILGKDFINILSEENDKDKFLHGRMNDAFLSQKIEDFGAHFYVCGPDKMISDINDILVKHGAKPESVVFEK